MQPRHNIRTIQNAKEYTDIDSLLQCFALSLTVRAKINCEYHPTNYQFTNTQINIYNHHRTFLLNALLRIYVCVIDGGLTRFRYLEKPVPQNTFQWTVLKKSHFLSCVNILIIWRTFFYYKEPFVHKEPLTSMESFHSTKGSSDY